MSNQVDDGPLPDAGVDSCSLRKVSVKYCPPCGSDFGYSRAIGRAKQGRVRAPEQAHRARPVLPVFTRAGIDS